MKKLTFITLLSISFLSGNLLHADTWRVNNNSLYTDGCDHCFAELQDAVDSPLVSDGDTIHIEASSTDYEGADINKQLVIIGTGYFLDENLFLQQNQFPANFAGNLNLDPGSEGTKLIGIRVQANNRSIKIYTSNIEIVRCFAGSQGIYFGNGSYTINNISIVQCYISDIHNVTYPDPINNLYISNCYIVYVDLTGPNYNLYEGIFKQNIVGGNINGSNGIEYYNNIFLANFSQDDNNTSNVFNNIFTDTVPAWLTGGNNVQVDSVDVFVTGGTTDGIWQVNPPTICPECYQGYDPGGVDDEEIGMFGGATPYVLSGIPNIPTIYKLHGSPDVYQGDTTHVTISTQSNN